MFPVRVRNNPVNVYDGRLVSQRNSSETRGTLENSLNENRNKEVSPAHSCKNQPRQAEDGPESHFQFSVGFLRMLESHGEGEPSGNEAESGENSEDDKENVVGHV